MKFCNQPKERMLKNIKRAIHKYNNDRSTVIKEIDQKNVRSQLSTTKPSVILIETDGSLSKLPAFETDAEKALAEKVSKIGYNVNDSFKYSQGAMRHYPHICRQHAHELILYRASQQPSRNKPYLFCSNWESFSRSIDTYQKDYIENNFVIKPVDYVHSEYNRDYS